MKKLNILMLIIIILVLAVPLIITIKSQAMDLNFTWDKNTGADYYVMSWGPASRAYTVNSEKILTENYTVKNLDNKQYFFAVKAFNNCGNSSDYSDEVTNTIPGVVKNLKIVLNITTTATGK